jgi:L-asparaginase II
VAVTAQASTRRAPGRSASAKNVRGARPPVRQPENHGAAPILVRQLRGTVAESCHRGHVVEVAVDGTVLRVLGDPDTIVNLRSAVKPLGLAALVEAGGVAEFDLSTAELAVMAGSHSGEDLHVRTLQGVFRRAGVSQQFLGCGSEGSPLDALTAARLSRDGEKPGSIRHMCSGQHASILLLCRLNGWPYEDYWRPDHPVQALYAATVARAFGTSPSLLVESTDSCGVPTYAFPLHEVARAYAMLAHPDGLPAKDSRLSLADALIRIRDAMIANPDFVAGTRDRLDSSVMKALPGRIVSKGGAEGLRGFSLLPGDGHAARGVALKIEDGGGFDRAVSAASVETLKQVGALDPAALRALARYHRPAALDPRGEEVGEAVAAFELAPVGELLS